MALRIINPGFYSIFQDQGRKSYGYTGVSPGLPMDEGLFMLANELVGNPPFSPAIEFMYSGPEFVSQSDVTISVTGDVSYVEINGYKFGKNKTLQLKKDDFVSIGPFAQGCRGYIGIYGLKTDATFLGSLTYEDKTKFGVKLIKNMILEGGMNPVNRLGFVKRKKGVIRVFKGMDFYRFTTEGQVIFTNQSYEVTEQANRMGIRLRGESISHLGGADILSTPIVMGTIQVPHNGQPIIMMSDHQPTGGYTVMGTVSKEDLWQLAQAKPKDKLTFVFVTIEKLEPSSIIYYKEIQSLTLDLSLKGKSYCVEVMHEDQL
ncbi:MAG: biotin-dependent carboxyltransferase family protein [Clostridia bacterium]|nr:biotin-dependent carboxyltransferase family protein [Clostridia bacterium]